MSSSVEYSRSVYRFIVDPHIRTAIWAVGLAAIGALVLIVDEIIKRNITSSPRKPKRPQH